MQSRHTTSTNCFKRSMLAEFAGAAVLPFAFLFVERVCRHRRRQDIAGLAVSFALLLLTHLPLAIIGSIALSFLRAAAHSIERKSSARCPRWRYLSESGSLPVRVTG